MDKFQECVNSYRVLINNEDPFDLMLYENIVDYVIDPFEEDKETLLVGLNFMIKKFEEYEHYEICNNILKYINRIENGI
jgi:hypothetical protein